MHKGVSWSLSFIMSNSVNSREFSGNIINNILGVEKLVPPFNKPLPSKNFHFLYILQVQDPGDLVFFNKVKCQRKLSTMWICFVNTCKILKGVN